VVRAHGLRGELVCEVVTEFPERFASTQRVFLGRPNETPRQHQVESSRLVRRGGRQQVHLKLAGVDDRNAAEAARGALVQVPEAEAWALPPGRFYVHQIIGLRVETAQGESLGTVTEVIETPANDVYVVEGGPRRILLPVIPQVIQEISPDQGRILVQLMPGL
jgi:16S rRNA processing protein RimM